jgi:hypothetical protein
VALSSTQSPLWWVTRDKASGMTSWTTKSFVLSVIWGIASRCEGNHKPSSNTEVMKACSYSSSWHGA